MSAENECPVLGRAKLQITGVLRALTAIAQCGGGWNVPKGTKEFKEKRDQSFWTAAARLYRANWENVKFSEIDSTI